MGIMRKQVRCFNLLWFIYPVSLQCISDISLVSRRWGFPAVYLCGISKEYLCCISRVSRQWGFPGVSLGYPSGGVSLGYLEEYLWALSRVYLWGGSMHGVYIWWYFAGGAFLGLYLCAYVWVYTSGVIPVGLSRSVWRVCMGYTLVL